MAAVPGIPVDGRPPSARRRGTLAYELVVDQEGRIVFDVSSDDTKDAGSFNMFPTLTSKLSHSSFHSLIEFPSWPDEL